MSDISNGRAGGSIILLGENGLAVPKSAQVGRRDLADRNLIVALRRQAEKAVKAAQLAAGRLDQVAHAYRLYLASDGSPGCLEAFLAAVEGAVTGNPFVEPEQGEAPEV